MLMLLQCHFDILLYGGGTAVFVCFTSYAQTMEKGELFRTLFFVMVNVVCLFSNGEIKPRV